MRLLFPVTSCVFAALATAPWSDAFVTPNSIRILTGSTSSFVTGRHAEARRRQTSLFAEEDGNSLQPKPPSSEAPIEEEGERLRVPVPPTPPTPPPSPPKRALTAEEEKLMVAAAVGGLFVGGFLGTVVDLQNPDIDLYVSPIVPPVVGALSLSAFGLVAGGSDGGLGNVVRKTLGGTTIAVGNGLVSVIRNAADSAAQAAKDKVKETTDGIKAIPSNIQKAAVRKVEETKEEIVAFPGKVKDAAVETAAEIAEEIKATPGRVAESTKRAVEDAVDDTLDAVEDFVDDVKAFPKKTLRELEESLNSLLGTDTAPRPPLAPPEPKQARRKEKVPGPPKGLPPPVAEEKKPLIPRIESLKIEAPKIEMPKIQPPKIEPPKIEVPKFSVPKIELPKAPAKTPQPPKSTPPPPKKATEKFVAEPAKEKTKLQSFTKDIFFDEKTGRFFEGGQPDKVETPKFEAPKLELPKLQVPKIELPKAEPTLTSAPPKVDSGAAERKAQAEEKKRAQEEAALKRKQAAEAKAEEDRQRKEEQERKKVEAAEKAREAAEERRQAAERARQEKAEAQKKAAEERQRQVEERRKQVEAIRQAQLEKNQKAKEEREAAAAKAKRQQAAEQSLGQAKSRTTISLGSLFGFGSSDEEESDAAPAGSKAPPGVPTISNWRQNPDGSITGKITGSSNFGENEAVTTSPVPKGAASGTLVKTSSGSRYYLGSKGGFSFGFGGDSAPVVDKQEEVRKLAEERRAAAQAAAAERKAAAEAAAREVAEKRKREAEEKRAAAEAQKRAAEERMAAAAAAAEEKKAAAEAQRRAAEERKAAAAEAAEEKKRLTEERKAAAAAEAEEKRRIAEEKRAAAAAAAEAKQREAEERKAAQAAAAEEKKRAAEARRAAAQASLERRKAPSSPSTPVATSPPNGVPVIKSWKKRADGGVSGRIYNSRSFTDGDFVETSPITKGNVENGSVVATKSGSRYFLSPEAAVNKASIFSAIKDLAGAEPGATITLTRERKEKEAKAAQESLAKAKPRTTFSLFGLGLGENDESPAPTPKAAPKKSVPTPKAAPRGVPTVSRWKKNSDGSVTGFISGSNAFRDGERVTTSPIKRGKISNGEVVITGSGSKYFLE